MAVILFIVFLIAKNGFRQIDKVHIHSGPVAVLVLPACDAGQANRLHGDFFDCGLGHNCVCAPLQALL